VNRLALRTVLPEQAVILHDVEHSAHLAKDEYSRTFGFD
jgi:hypothetical protein